MTPRQRLDEYLAQLRQRLRIAIFARAGAALTATLVALLALAVYFLNLSGFPVGGVIVSRVALFIAVAALVLALIWWPLRRLNKDSGAQQFERRLPDQQGRIQTYLEQQSRASQASPLIDLLAEDALNLTQRTPAEKVVAARGLWIAGAVTLVAVAVLFAMLVISRTEWGY